MRLDASGAPTSYARDSFTTASTSIKMSCPEGVTGLERIMLAAQGDLQRLLSAYLSRTISIECIYTHTAARTAPASPENPIKQARQVHLKCGPRLLCVATSTVTVTSPKCERLLLDEKYAIGQIFRTLKVHPQFSLIHVDTEVVSGKRQLERTYILETEGISCEILEVFPDRDMFDLGEAWLEGEMHPDEKRPFDL